ncbi:MAG: DUF559 domain-containing protein [Actinomycetota bacterium]
MTSTDRRIAAIATGQLGVFARHQARAVGITDHQLRSRVESGSLEQIGRNAFRVRGAPRTHRSDLGGLMLDVGGEVYAAGRTAAALHGFDGYSLRPPFELVIPRGRDLRRIGHRIRTTLSIDLIDRANVENIRCLSPARTLIDLARTESAEQLAVAFDSGLRDGRFNESLVHRRIVALRSKGRYGIPRLLAAIEATESVRGGHSWLEREFLRLVERAQLPRPEMQQVLTSAGDRMVRVDFRFAGTPVVVEVLGYRFHASATALARDAERLNALIADGFQPYQFTYDHVVTEPERVVTQIGRALAPHLDARRSA